MVLLYSNVARIAVVMIGRGLIGSEIEQSLLRRENWTLKQFAFPWQHDAQPVRDQAICRMFQAIEQINSTESCVVHTVWSAGRAGFTADHESTKEELNLYRQIVAFAESVEHRLGHPSHLHVLSSAGGLFEGVRGINQSTACCPARPYGELKATQESIAMNALVSFVTTYRPTSVYSTVQPQKRRGLIPTVMWNTLRNQSTVIYGNYDTLRDYIWAADVGRFIADRIMNPISTQHRESFLLASGVPTSLGRIIQVIENVLMRKVPMRFTASADSNVLDITVCPNFIPVAIHRTDLTTSIRQIHLQLMSDGII